MNTKIVMQRSCRAGQFKDQSKLCPYQETIATGFTPSSWASLLRFCSPPLTSSRRMLFFPCSTSTPEHWTRRATAFLAFVLKPFRLGGGISRRLIVLWLVQDQLQRSLQVTFTRAFTHELFK